MCYNFATFVLYLDVITLIYRENRLTSSEPCLSGTFPYKERIASSKYFEDFNVILEEIKEAVAKQPTYLSK